MNQSIEKSLRLELKHIKFLNVQIGVAWLVLYATVEMRAKLRHQILSHDIFLLYKRISFLGLWQFYLRSFYSP